MKHHRSRKNCVVLQHFSIKKSEKAIKKRAILAHNSSLYFFSTTTVGMKPHLNTLRLNIVLSYTFLYFRLYFTLCLFYMLLGINHISQPCTRFIWTIKTHFMPPGIKFFPAKYQNTPIYIKKFAMFHVKHCAFRFFQPKTNQIYCV